MIYSLRGTLTLKTSDLAVIECGGVGYGCRTTLNTLSSLGRIGDEAFLLTYMNVREDCVELFGFASEEELYCYKMLISVSGVGPKVALSILSDTTPERFALNVASGDYKALTKTKGVGPKVAQRVILELKDKIAKEQLSGAAFTSDVPDFSSIKVGNTSEAVSALVVLGYSQSEAASVIAKLDPNFSVEQLITQALKVFAKNM